jgi:hypothetical protein
MTRCDSRKTSIYSRYVWAITKCVHKQHPHVMDEMVFKVGGPSIDIPRGFVDFGFHQNRWGVARSALHLDSWQEVDE